MAVSTAVCARGKSDAGQFTVRVHSRQRQHTACCDHRLPSAAPSFHSARTWPGLGTTEAWYTASRSAERSGRDMSRFEAVTRTTSCRTKAPSAPHCCACCACCAAGGCWSLACCCAAVPAAGTSLSPCCASAGGSRLLAGLPALIAALPSRSPSARVGGRLSGWRALRDTALPVSRSARGGVSAEVHEIRAVVWYP